MLSWQEPVWHDAIRGARTLRCVRHFFGSFAGRAGPVRARVDVRVVLRYIVVRHMATQPLDRELKKGSAELLILSLVESRARHGYEISKLIEARSEGTLRVRVASLYPLLYRLEARGWIQGRWVEKAGQRRRRFYKLTREG